MTRTVSATTEEQTHRPRRAGPIRCHDHESDRRRCISRAYAALGPRCLSIAPTAGKWATV
eukprot:483027-Hanusia_phi.AAC.2